MADVDYCFVAGIQQYMFENARIDNIFTDFYFEQFTASLNEVLTDYPVRLNAQGTLLTLMCKSRTPNLGAAVIVWRPKAIFTSKHKISDVVFSLLFFYHWYVHI